MMFENVNMDDVNELLKFKVENTQGLGNLIDSFKVPIWRNSN